MATEPDQTRWVGIRPTPDCNDIPTTTKKVAPAISDLQAIKDIWRYEVTWLNRDCSVNFWVTTGQPDAGEIVVLNNIAVKNIDSLCDMEIAIFDGGSFYYIAGFYSIEPNTWKSWSSHIVLERGSRIYAFYKLGGVSDDLSVSLIGHKIGVY